MRMVSTLYTFQIVIVVSMVWRPSYAVNELSCGATTNLNPSTAATYRFGDYTNPYGTGISCNFNFIPSDASERILIQVFPQCTPSADVLRIDNGDNKCCYGCTVPISTKSSSFQVSLTTDSTTGPQELGFEIKIVTGKDESNCTTSNPSSNTSVSVGASPVIITSPGFPSKYPSNRDCSYIITPQDSSKGLSLTFDVISLDYYKKCYDYIELGIYNTEDKICTNDTNELFLTNERYTSGGETYLHFYSDASYEGYGFRVRIIQVDLGATQPPTAASTTAVQTVETTTSETTAASTTAAQTTETTAASTTAAQTTETTSALTTAAQTTKTTAASTTAPQTTETTSTTAAQTTAETTAVSATDAQTTAAATTAAQTTETTAASATVGTTAETTVESTTSETTPTSENTAGTATVRSFSSTVTASTAESTAVESTAAPHTDPTTETIESNETTQDSTTTSSTSMTTKPEVEVKVSSTELPPTTSFPKTTNTEFFDTTSSTSMTTKPEVKVRVSSTATTDFFDGLTTPAKVVALTGLVFLGVVPLFSIVVFCLRKKSKKPSRDNQSHNPYFKRDAQYYNTYHYPMTHKPLFYQYWGEY